jgi:hypothetical protein
MIGHEAVAAPVAEVAPVAQGVEILSPATSADLEAAALAVLAEEPTLTGADLGRRLNVSTRSGQRLKLKLATAVA